MDVSIRLLDADFYFMGPRRTINGTWHPCLEVRLHKFGNSSHRIRTERHNFGLQMGALNVSLLHAVLFRQELVLKTL